MTTGVATAARRISDWRITTCVLTYSGAVDRPRVPVGDVVIIVGVNGGFDVYRLGA